MAKLANLNRGRVEKIRLSRPITFNDYIINEAVIEIDHINYGLDKHGKLKLKARSDFTVKEITKFIMMLDGEDITADEYRGPKSRFVIKITCPIKRLHFGKIFIMVFEHDHFKQDELYTVTIYPGW